MTPMYESEVVFDVVTTFSLIVFMIIFWLIVFGVVIYFYGKRKSHQ